MNKPLVSIIIPTRNRPHYLQQAVESVYSQSYQQFEVIVVDDGSTQELGHIAEKFDQRLRFFRQQHAGVSVARNTGIAQSKGEYIAFLDDDDVFLPERIERGVEYLRAHPEVVWLCSAFQLTNEHLTPFERPAVVPPEAIGLNEIALFPFIHASSVMVRRQALLEVGGFSEGVRLSEDYDMWARLTAKGKGAGISQTLTLFRQHSNNTPLNGWKLYAQNRKILNFIAGKASWDNALRQIYIKNLQRIILEGMQYRGEYLNYYAFKIWRVISNY